MFGLEKKRKNYESMLFCDLIHTYLMLLVTKFLSYSLIELLLTDKTFVQKLRISVTTTT